MTDDSRINFKNRFLAAVLAYLLPGAGHLYQGRTFKAAIYSVCILSTFFYGLKMSEGSAVFYQMEPGRERYGYFAQVGAGSPALFALVQKKRFESPDNQDITQATLAETIDEPFKGFLIENNQIVTSIKGQIQISSSTGRFGPEAQGTFTGKSEEGDEIKLELGGAFQLDRPINAGVDRFLKVDITSDEDEFAQPAQQIQGSISRPLFDRLEVPVDDPTMESLRARLGRQFDLAEVFTWIAGLLNILAVWDAYEGPAYGYGDETEEDETEDKATSTA